MPKVTMLAVMALLFTAMQVRAQQAPFVLNEQEQRHLDAILTSWQARSQSIKTMECEFQKWRFDVAAAPADTYASWSQGTIKYMSPDRGVFLEENIRFYDGKNADGSPIYKAKPNRFGEWWVCTGTELVFMNREEKVSLIEELPPQMQGQQLFESPLPFVFNLNADRMKQRFWIRAIAPPPGRQEEYWLEVYPKFQADAQNYKLVQVVVSAKEFLPKALLIYPPNFDEKTAPNKEVYEFKNVKVNQNIIERAAQLLFQQQFINPQPPSNDWKIIRKPSAAAQPSNALGDLKSAAQPNAQQPGQGATPALR